jgi:transposase
MSMTKPLDLDLDLPPSPPAGWVSPTCRFTDTQGVRFVLVREVITACYDLADRNTERLVWVQLHRTGHANQVQIAQALKLGLRTINGWVRRYREQGVAGLIARPLTGRRADPEKAALIRRYRQLGHKLTEIARLVNVSLITVKRVLARERETQALSLPTLGTPVAEATSPLAGRTSAPVAAAAPEVLPSTERPASAEAVAGSGASPSGTLPPGAEVPEPQLSSRPGVDPQDRSLDRAMARLGLLEDAEPVFAPGENLPWVGVFLAVALLGQEPLLPVAQKLWGSLGAAFYGLRTMLVTLVLLALLRMKRPEQLRRYDAVALGRVLGLDRAPEVKTLRRKLHALSAQDQGMEFLEQLAQARVAALEAKPQVIYVDGHVSVYSGQHKIGEVYSARDKRVVKGTTQTWVNLPGRTPLFCVTSEFNEGLVAALPGAVKQATEVCGTRAWTVVFDRGGYSGLGLEQLRLAGHHFITYRRGPLKPWPLERFKKVRTQLGGRVYDYAPAEQAMEIPVYEAGPSATGQRGAPRKTDTGRRVSAREIRVIRPDGGQTALLVSEPERAVDEACTVLFGRWGAQENIFKYLIAEYDLDATAEYGTEELSDQRQHPNPAYVQRQKRIAALVAQRDRLLGKLGLKLLATDDAEKNLPRQLAQWTKKAAGKKALQLQAEIQTARAELATVEPRVSAKAEGYSQLKSQLKLLSTGIKLSAYYVETKLLDMVAPYYRNQAKEGRKLIAAVLQSPGSIRLRPGEIRVQLGRQSSPCRTRAIGQLCEELNRLKPIYPGTKLHIIFEPPVH